MKKRAVLSLVITGLVITACAYLALDRNNKTVQTSGIVSTTNTAPDSATPKSASTIDKKGAYVDYVPDIIARTPNTKILFFHASWCPQCQSIDTDIKSKGAPQGTTIIKVDYDSNQALRKKYGVTLQTTLVKVDDNGNLVKKFVAYDDPTLESIVEESAVGMALLILSFIAGVLTVAAPCILPLLPIIIGGSLVDAKNRKPKNQWLRPLCIAASLVVSVVLFTLLIKATTALLGVPQLVWQLLSGMVVMLLGINYLWPHGWEWFSARVGFYNKSNVVLGRASQKQGIVGALLIGAALGPVFSSCSPTYALIVATILPKSFGMGLLYLSVYAAGMSLTLLLIAFVGQAFVTKLRWLSNPNGWFKRLIGMIFIVVGLSVSFGLDKKVQTYALEHGWYAPTSNIEHRLSK